LELGAFRGLNHAKNYDDYLAAIRLFRCPGQNFVFASKSGKIAWWQQASFPAKWRYQGDFIMPGSDSSFRWQGMIADEDNIHQIDPERGFVSSANQLPADTGYPYYLGGKYDVYRGYIINRMLNAAQAATPDDMKRMQTDNYNVFGEMAVPLLLKNVDSDSLTEAARAMLDLVKTWNFRADADSKGQTVFFNWWNEFAREVWSDELTRKDGLPTAWPQDNTLFEAIARDSAFAFVDNIHTPDTETLRIVVTRGLQKATDLMASKKDLTWGAWKDTRVSHLLSGLPAFSRLNLRMGGGSKIINATKENHGPSWRVVVHMTDKTEAYGVYPGGQSGNPGSRFYDSFVDTWASGEYNKLWFMEAGEKNTASVKWVMRFSNL
jgi:penicillin amidase